MKTNRRCPPPRPEGLPVMITAHAGFAEEPEAMNTLDNVIKSVRFGPEAIEADVLPVEMKDGTTELLLGHDKAEGPSLKEVFSLLLGTHSRSSELGENGGRVRIQADCKGEDMIPGVLLAAEEAGFPYRRLILAGDNSYEHVLRDRDRIVRAVEQGLDFWMNPDFILSYEAMEHSTDAFIARIRELDIPGLVVNSCYENISDALLERFQAENIRLSVWTLNDRKSLEAFMTKGMYNITSRVEEALLLRRALIGGA